MDRVIQNTLKTNILILQQYAINKGGKLLSTEYKNNKTKLLWECKEGHQWQAKWNMISSQNCWCPECVGVKKLDISILQQHAFSRGGKLLTETRIRNRSKLLWECGEGHQWQSVWGHIQQGSWCPTCAGYFTTAINVLKEYASYKQGKLLSETYKNNRTPLLWECKEGHQWQAKWTDIKSKDSWCPKCLHKTEEFCRQILEWSLNTTFKKYRVYYDKINVRKYYEFDGYSEKLKIAFEYHGAQHYKYPNWFHRTKEQFLAAQERDKKKEQYCSKNGITLIVIPYFISDISLYINNLIENLELYLCSQ